MQPSPLAKIYHQIGERFTGAVGTCVMSLPAVAAADGFFEQAAGCSDSICDPVRFRVFKWNNFCSRGFARSG